MITFRDLTAALRKLGINRSLPVILHASYRAFGQIQGGAETLLGALLSTWDALIAPAFTYATMLVPEVGPPDNAIQYGSGTENNARAVFFRPELPADRKMGVVAELLRQRPQSVRSSHPCLSFCGVGVAQALSQQTLDEPLEPLRWLARQGGWALLLGVDHTSNTAIHLGERLARRKQFLRWALTPQGVRECQHVPGCSAGFGVAARRFRPITRQVSLGSTRIQAVPVLEMVEAVRQWIGADPLALLCDQPACFECQTVRQQVAGEKK
jgi:aminoglycoside 3-N-acetyltransferase